MRILSFLMILLLTITHRIAFACDICGCSSGNYFIGPVPQFDKHFIGVRYSFRQYNTILASDNAQFSKDFYQTIELWGGIQLGKNWQALVFVPYNSNHSVTDDGSRMNKGFGDITVIGNYKILDIKKLNKDTVTFNHQLWIGLGLKMPTGVFSLDTSELISSANSQAGTGSFDFLASISYAYQIEQWGLNCNANYKFNQQANHFKFGDRFSSSAFIMRTFQVSKYRIIPNAGLLFESMAPNESYKKKVDDTGGNVLMAAFGIETRFNKVGIGFNVQIPITQNISNQQTKTNLRGMVHVSYMF